MPTYTYHCHLCRALVDVFGKLSASGDISIEGGADICSNCGIRMYRVMRPTAIHYKGSGFYSTDYNKNPIKKDEGGDAPDVESKE